MTDHPEEPAIPGPSSPAVPASPLTGADARLQGGSLRLFRVAGIDVWLHWSWFIFALLRLQPGAADDTVAFVHYDAQVWYGLEYLALFGLVLLHEFGHVLACRSVGGIADRIVLWPLGGVAYVDPPARPGALLWSIAAGPLVNLLLVVPTVGFWAVCRAAGCQEAAPDVYRFAAAVAWINGYLLVFNLLPVYPLDGGKMLQALLWFGLGRARSLLVAAVLGLVTALGLLLFAIVARSLVWGVLAGFGLLFSLVGLQGARGLRRMLQAPPRPEAACPSCGAAPPVGNFWACLRCFTSFDVFAAAGSCPNCSTPLTAVFCPTCGRSRPYPEWQPAAVPLETPDQQRPALPARADPSPPPPEATRPPTVAQRAVWGLIFAFLALGCCGLPNVEKQPWGLIVWTAGGAILGARSAGTMTRFWRNAQARRQLQGNWLLVEEDGQALPDGAAEPRRLILKGASYEERLGDRREVHGACWTDPQAEPPAISFTPKTGPDAGKPRPGIYRLEGESLTVCLAYPGHPRPTALLAQPDVQQVRVYRRGGKAGA